MCIRDSCPGGPGSPRVVAPKEEEKNLVGFIVTHYVQTYLLSLFVYYYIFFNSMETNLAVKVYVFYNYG